MIRWKHYESLPIVKVIRLQFYTKFVILLLYKTLNKWGIENRCCVDSRFSCHQHVYALFAKDLNSKWAEITCSAPQGTKLVALLFLAVINHILVDFDEHFKYVNDLPTLIKFFMDKLKAIPQFQGELKDILTDQWRNNR